MPLTFLVSFLCVFVFCLNQVADRAANPGSTLCGQADPLCSPHRPGVPAAAQEHVPHCWFEEVSSCPSSPQKLLTLQSKTPGRVKPNSTEAGRPSSL